MGEEEVKGKTRLRVVLGRESARREYQEKRQPIKDLRGVPRFQGRRSRSPEQFCSG
jgi:hypothetical protein